MREYYGELPPEREVYVPTRREELEDFPHDFFTTETTEDEQTSTHEHD